MAQKTSQRPHPASSFVCLQCGVVVMAPLPLLHCPRRPHPRRPRPHHHRPHLPIPVQWSAKIAIQHTYR